MPAQVGNLQVRVGADITGLKTGMGQAQREVARGVRGMQKQVSDLQLTFKEMSTFSGRSLRILGGAWAAQFGARAILSATDAFKSFTAQLRLATSQYGSFAQASKDVRDIAERSRSDLLATAELYSALQRNADQFGATQAEVARVTETVSKAFKISGATADEAANATRQLVQAFQSGRLQGDEFRSVLENAPRLARLLADSLGTTIGKLREMSKEGKLTSDILIRAFSDKKFTAQLDAEFAKLPVTFDQAMGQIYNAAVLALGAFDQGGQFSNAIADFATNGVKAFGDLEGAAYRFGQGVSELFTAVDVIRSALGSLETDGIGAFVGLKDATLNWRDALGTVLGVIDGVANAAANLYNAPGNTIRSILGRPQIYNPVNLRGDFIRRTDESRIAAFMRSHSLVPETVRTPPPFHPSATGAGGGAKKGGRTSRAPRDRSDDVAYQFEREQMQADQAILQAKQELAASSEDRARIAVQLIQLDHDMQAAEIDDRIRRAQRDNAEGKITDAALQQAEAQAAVLKARNDELAQIKLRVFTQEQMTRQEQAVFDANDQRYEFTLDALRAADDAATTQADHRRIQLEILDEEMEQRRLELEHSKQLAIRNGATQQEIANIQARIDELSVQRATGAAGVIRNTQSPLEQWAQQVPKTAQEIIESFQRIQVEGLDSLADAITDVITGTKSLKDAFSEVAKSIIADIIRMSVKMLIFRALSGILGSGLGQSKYPTIPGQPDPLAPLPSFAGGGSFDILGMRGTDRNVLALNGIPIANVSYGERLSVGNDNTPGGITINQTFAPNFAGNAATQEDLVRMGMITRQATLDAIRQERRRAS